MLRGSDPHHDPVREGARGSVGCSHRSTGSAVSSDASFQFGGGDVFILLRVPARIERTAPRREAEHVACRAKTSVAGTSGRPDQGLRRSPRCWRRGNRLRGGGRVPTCIADWRGHGHVMRKRPNSQRECSNTGPPLRAPVAAASQAASHSASDSVQPLRQEIDQLRQAMDSRPVIDMARGILMARFGCSSESAWEILVKVSQHSNTKLRGVADCLVEAAQPGGEMPQDLQQHLSLAAVQNSRDERATRRP
ncbi:ANTAR domain-containing response regulator [Streptomyces umbrinus]|uniref:ANTAR domain-containing response regulator n=1 Tax=Streptomyces umbrinus TaxID=67370 RepID=UPI0033D39B92